MAYLYSIISQTLNIVNAEKSLATEINFFRHFLGDNPLPKKADFAFSFLQTSYSICEDMLRQRFIF